MKQIIEQKYLTGERALFHASNLHVIRCTFAEGESPLKESSDVELQGSLFKWKYPLWYSKNISMSDCTLFEMARAGIWYTENIYVENSIIEAPKSFRRCNDVTLKNILMPFAAETLWNCNEVVLEQVTATGDYFAMNSCNMRVKELHLVGNYSFDGARNVEIHQSKLLSKDAFWNTENVTVYDSYIFGEYLGWNAKNLKFVNCFIESKQGLCYIDTLLMENCHFINTTLAFEYSTVNINGQGKVDSVLNPSGGYICVDDIGEVIIEETMVDPDKTEIIIRGGMEDGI